MNKEQLRKINLLQSNLCFIPELLNYIAFYAENNKDANKHDLACMIYALSDLLEPALHEQENNISTLIFEIENGGENGR